MSDDGDVNYKVAWFVPVDGGDSGMNYEDYLGEEVEISLRVYILNSDSESEVDESLRGELIDFPDLSDFDPSESEEEKARSRLRILLIYLTIVMFAAAGVMSLAASLNGR